MRERRTASERLVVTVAKRTWKRTWVAIVKKNISLEEKKNRCEVAGVVARRFPGRGSACSGRHIQATCIRNENKMKTIGSKDYPRSVPPDGSFLNRQ